MSDFQNSDWSSMSDVALMKTIGAFIRHHRLSQNKSQEEVARAAKISRSTLSLLERGERTLLVSFIKVIRILNLLYVMDVFKVKNEISPIEYAKLKKNSRKHARSKNENSKVNPGW